MEHLNSSDLCIWAGYMVGQIYDPFRETQVKMHIVGKEQIVHQSLRLYVLY
jgi:hypothetical protein